MIYLYTYYRIYRVSQSVSVIVSLGINTRQNDISQTIELTFSGDVPYILPTVQVSMEFEVL